MIGALRVNAIKFIIAVCGLIYCGFISVIWKTIFFCKKQKQGIAISMVTAKFYEMYQIAKYTEAE